MGHKVVYNRCYGGYGLSKAALELYVKLGGKGYGNFRIARHDPLLVAVVEQLGEKANGDWAKLAIYEIKGKLYRIKEYDGCEEVIEPDDLEWTVI